MDWLYNFTARITTAGCFAINKTPLIIHIG